MSTSGWFRKSLLAVAAGTLLFLPQSLLAASGIGGGQVSAEAKQVPAAILERIATGAAQDVIVLYDDRDIETEAGTYRNRSGEKYDDARILAFKAGQYQQRKQQVDLELTGDGATVTDYSNLPMAKKRFRTRQALERLLANPQVVAVYEDRPIYPHLAYSLPFIGQPSVAGAGIAGSGASVAIIDTGINYTLPAFGSCTAPGVPAGCRVAASVDVTGNNVTLNTDPAGHGTNVAGIVAGVASGTRITAINAFAGGTSSTSWVIAGINWAIANKSAYNIGTLNMSLGDSSNNTAPCAKISTNPFVTPINNLRNAGIIPVASSGNNGYTSGIANPACTPGVVSVGAVYDANWGGPYSWSSGCIDTAASAPDRIPCFSNSAYFLTMLAPGAFITAAGIQMAGTSQAAPHAAAALVVLRENYPGDTLDQTVSRLTSSGVPITDSRDPLNPITKPRLNLLAAISPPENDMFATPAILAGDMGQITANNLNATKEPGEPDHAGNAGGRSVWWSWTPAYTGIVSFDTHGSNFDTLLAVYGGRALDNLSQIVANDNDNSPGNTSGAVFTALAGTEYLIAVDGFNGASGGVSINWSLSQQADLEITMSQSPVVPFEGGQATYTMIVTNHGPSVATGFVVTDSLPAGVSFYSASPGCTLSGGAVVCTPGDLASNTAATISIVVDIHAAGDLTNSAQVSSSINDPQPDNNMTALTITVSPAEAVPACSPWGLLAVALCLAGIVGGLSNRCGTAPPSSGRGLR